MFTVNNKDTRMKAMALTIVDFKHVNAGWVYSYN